MGTRNLTCVIAKGQMKVAQYGQWDGYPTGQGDTIAHFLHVENEGLDAFREDVSKCRFLSDEEVKDRFDRAKNFEKEFPELSRNTGAGILKLIENGKRELNDNFKFGVDSLFCEWAYVVDLDNEKVEVYQGFQKKKHDKGRWAHLEPKAKASYEGAEQYFPVALIKTYSFADFTSEAMGALEKELSSEE